MWVYILNPLLLFVHVYVGDWSLILPKTFLLQYLFLLSFRFRDASAVFYCIWDASHFSIYTRTKHQFSHVEIVSSWRTPKLLQCTTNGHLIHVMLCEAEDVEYMDQSSAMKWMYSIHEQIYLSLQREFCPMDNVCVCALAILTCFYIMSYLILYERNFECTEKQGTMRLDPC